MIETGEVRRLLKHALERARHAAEAHRVESDLAREWFEQFLTEQAAPVFRQVASALRPEGYAFQVFTPAGSVRLSSDRSADDFIELALDTARSPVALVGRTSRTRGRRVIETERIVREGAAVRATTEHDVLGFLLEEVGSVVER